MRLQQKAYNQMIIETKEDVVRLLGSLHKNQWISIRAAAEMLLHDYPAGIVIDCSGLEDISEHGAKTFLEAMKDIEAAKARIIVASLPKELFSFCKKVPGVRSQLPVAETVEEARASLRASYRSATQAAQQNGHKHEGVILVPLLTELDLTYGAHLAARLARSGKDDVRLIYFLEVSRTQPLNAPLPEEEKEAQATLERALQSARAYNATVWESVERVRDATEGILTAIKNYDATMVVLGAPTQHIGGDSYERFHQLVDTLLNRANCEVIVGRLKPGA
jgi:nucleotide-binding universal stress UspA family protein/anti-anti-sigma regulatory factor